MTSTVVIAYDVSEDRRRARLAATLQVCGDRVQRSVFVCTLDDDQLADLTARIPEIIDPDTDAVHVFRQCLPCWDAVNVLGQATIRQEAYYWAIL